LWLKILIILIKNLKILKQIEKRMNLNFLDTIFSDLPNGGSSIKKSFATLPKHTPTNQSNKKKPTQLEDRTLIKIHDPFKKAYDCLKGIIQNNHGLD
jgi:ribonuclease P protein subunit POP4